MGSFSAHSLSKNDYDNCHQRLKLVINRLLTDALKPIKARIQVVKFNRKLSQFTCHS